MKTKATRWVLVLLLAVAAATMLPAADPPTTIVYYRPGALTNPLYVADLEKTLNIHFEFVNETWADMPRKRDLMLAAGDTIDVVDYMGGGMLYYVEQGLVQPLDKLVTRQRHPFLWMSINAKTFASAKVDGKSYFIPGVSHGSLWSLGVRADWMKKLGLAMPKDENDFYNLLRAFVKNDPTGLTVGMQLEGKMAIRRSVYPILLTFGVPISEFDMDKDFIIEGGKLKTVLVQPNLKEAFRYVNRLYLEKLVNTDFAGFNSYPQLCDKYWFAGKGGVAWGPYARQEANVQKADPGAALDSIPPWSAKGYKFVRGGGAMEMDWYAIPTSSKYPLKALDLLEYVNTKKGAIDRVAGVENVQYRNYTEDGYYDVITEKADPNSDWYYGLGSASMRGYIPWTKYSTFEEAYANRVLIDDRKNIGSKLGVKSLIALANQWRGDESPFRFLNMPALVDVKTELYTAVETGWIKMVAAGVGQFDAEWNAYVESLNKAGLAKWVAGYQAFYDKNMK